MRCTENVQRPQHLSTTIPLDRLMVPDPKDIFIMYSTRRGSTGSQLSEGDRDRKMRLVSDSNRRAERQLEKHLKEIDQHLQVNLKQIGGDCEMKSVSPPLSTPSPKYLASSSESMEGSSSSTPRSHKLHRPIEQTNSVRNNKKNKVLREKQGMTEQKIPKDNIWIQPREKTFTIIDHGPFDETENVTDNSLETRTRIRALDVHDKDRLLQGDYKVTPVRNIRNEKVSSVPASKKLVRSEYSQSNRVFNSTSQTLDNTSKNKYLISRRNPDRKQSSDSQPQIGIISPKEIAGKEQNVFVFDSNETKNVIVKKAPSSKSKIPTAQNNGQFMANEELNRRQLRKMNILWNLNQKHLSESSANEIFVKKDSLSKSSNKFSNVPAPPQSHLPTNTSVDAEKPRPKSAMFSSRRRPRFTSFDDDESVFLDDLDIIDFDDDGESSSDDDMLGSSFVGKLHDYPRHSLGLHTRSTSDISPSTFHRQRDSDFRSLRPSNTKLASHTNLSEETNKVLAEPNKSSGLEERLNNVPSLSHESLQNGNSPHLKNGKQGDVELKVAPTKPDRNQGRPQFPRKLKPLFQPPSPTDSGNKTDPRTVLESEESITDLDSQSNIHQPSSSYLQQNKKLQRSRQKSWTPGIGPTNSREILRRPLASVAMNAKQRAKTDARTAPRRRARTSSELKKSSAKDLETLKSGGNIKTVPNVELIQEQNPQTSEFSQGMRNCRYLRGNSDTDSRNSVNVESF